MFTGFDRIADFEIGADGPHVHVSDSIVFERPIEHFGDNHIAAVPAAIIGRKRIDDAVARNENLSREGLSRTNGIAGSLIELSKFSDIFTGFSNECDNGVGSRVDDSAHAIILFSDMADVMAFMFAARSAIELSHQIAVRVWLGHILGNR